MPLFIDGNSVKMAGKTFTATEIERLKSTNGQNTNTTYSVFQEFDKDTLDCAVTWGNTTTYFKEY